MKKNTKFLLIYIAILFSFALVLILFAGLTQNNYAKQIAENQGIKQNLVEITEQYQTLTDSMKVINNELETSKKEIADNEVKIAALEAESNTTALLINALILDESGKHDEAEQKIAQIDKQQLTEQQLYIYNKIIK